MKSLNLKILIVIFAASSLLFLFSCEDDGKSKIIPKGVDIEDLIDITDGGYSGDGEINELGGDSGMTPEEEGASDDNADKKDQEGDDGDKSGDDDGDKSGDDDGDKSGDDDGDKSGDDDGDKSGDDDGDKSGDDDGDKNGDDDGKKSKDKGKKSKDDGKKSDDECEDCKGPCYKKGKSLVRHGKDVCYLEGMWYQDANTIFTYEGEEALAGFRYNKLPSGKYLVRVMAKHWVKHNKKEKLPKDFKAYKVMVAAEGIAEEISIPASVKGWEKGTVVLDLLGGETDVCISWINVTEEVNFQIHSIKLKRIGDSERSAISGYAGIALKNKAVVISVLSGLVFVFLLMIFVIRHREVVRNDN